MKKRSNCSIGGLKYPSSDQISGRSSTICRSMACTMLERIACSPEDEAKWMTFFRGDTCAYCGKKATHLDHLYPLVIDRKPTGYGTEPANLVPCCSNCNQPKGNMEWEVFMRSDMCEHTIDPELGSVEESKEKRIQTIREFQQQMPPKKVEFSEELLQKWASLLEDFDNKLKEANDALLKWKEAIYASTEQH